MEDTSATLEIPEDAGSPPGGEVKRWLLELNIADKEEKAWRKTCERIIKRYRAEDKITIDAKTSRTQFNILWSNVETLAPALYNSTPQPDVRRRFRDSDPIGKTASELLERSLTYAIDAYDFDDVMQDCINDYLLTGRGIVRVRYMPSIKTMHEPMQAAIPRPAMQAQAMGVDGHDAMGSEHSDGDGSYEALEFEQVLCELVQWGDFRRGPGKRWHDVGWVAFRSYLTREELTEKFGKIGAAIELEDVEMGDENKDVDDKQRDAFKRLPVWEIWDKEERKVIFIAQSYKDKPLKIEDDPLGLDGFFPIPRPIYSIRSTKSLVPIPEYVLYEDQAKELDRITVRIGKLTNTLKIRGIYDSTLSEIAKLMGDTENEYIPSQNVTALIERGGLEKAIWTMPIEMAANVMTSLYTARDQVKQTIYEITGISDILRGATNPNETATAQGIKNQWGTLRLQRRQAEIQRFARDILRLKAEIIAEKFQPETVLEMTNMKLPTQQEVMQARMQLQKMQMQAQMQAPPQPGVASPQQPPPPDPKLIELEQHVSLEDVFGFLRDNSHRQFRIDIETDSTIAGALQQDQKNITDLLTGIASFMQSVEPAVMSGALPMPAAKAMLLSAVRRFKLGSEVEDELDKIPDQLPPKPAEDNGKGEAELQKQQLALQGQELENNYKDAHVKLREQGLQMREKAHGDRESALNAKESDMHDKHGEREAALNAREAGMNDQQTEIDGAGDVTVQEVQKMIMQAQEQMSNFMQQKLNEFVAHIGNTQTDSNSQQSQMMQIMATMAESMSAPKRIIRDATGRIVGAETVQ